MSRFKKTYLKEYVNYICVFSFFIFGFSIIITNVSAKTNDFIVKEDPNLHIILRDKNTLSKRSFTKAESMADFAMAYLNIRKQKKLSKTSELLLLQSIQKDPYCSFAIKYYLNNCNMQRQYQKIINELQPVVKKHQDAVILSLAVADAMINSGKNKEALKLLENTLLAIDYKLDRNVDSELLSSLIIKLSNLYLETDNVKAGEGMWDDALDYDFLNSNIKIRVAAAEFFANYADKGPDGLFAGWSKRRYRKKLNVNLAAFEKLWKSSKSFNLKDARRVIKIYHRYKLPERSEELVMSALMSVPSSSDLMFLLAEVYKQNKQFGLEAAVWRVLISSESYPDAAARWRALHYGIEDAEYFYYYEALAYYDNKNYRKAIEAFKIFLKFQPENSSALLLCGYAYMRLGNFKKALEEFSKNKELPETNYYMAKCYESMGQYRDAVKKMEDAVQAAESMNKRAFLDKNFYFDFALMSDNAHDFDKTEKILLQLHAEYPEDPFINNFLGFIWAVKGINFDKAEELVKKALVKQSNNPEILDSMAWVYYKQKKYNKAVQYILKSIKNDGLLPSAVIADHAGDIYFAAGDIKNALKYWNLALTIHSEFLDRKAVEKKINSVR